jgi:hypothetical protein
MHPQLPCTLEAGGHRRALVRSVDCTAFMAYRTPLNTKLNMIAVNGLILQAFKVHESVCCRLAWPAWPGRQPGLVNILHADAESWTYWPNQRGFGQVSARYVIQDLLQG